MVWICGTGPIVCEEDVIGGSIASVEVIAGVVEEVVGTFGVQFPSMKDIKLIQMMRKRGTGRDIL